MSDAPLDALQVRWDTFLRKVRSRLEEINAEATEGLEELIATEVLDPIPLAAAINELHARLYALEQKVDTAWSDTIEPGCEEADTADERRRVTKMEAQGHHLVEVIRQAAQDLEADARVKAAVRLKSLAEAERASRTLSCTKCGAPLPEPEVLHRVENLSCPNCGAVNTVRPGIAMTMYYQGGALQAKARAGAKDAQAALDAAEARFQALRHPVQADGQTLRQAHEAYWTQVCRAQGQETPDWTEAKLDGEVRIKVQQAMSHYERDARRWQAVTHALELAARSDVPGLLTFLDGDGDDLGFDADALVEAAEERDDARALETAKKVRRVRER